MREVRGNAKCPCQSGRRYAACCKHQALKWVVDENGEIHKHVPLTPEARELLEKTSEDFLRIFEREPRKNSDPIYLLKYVIGD